MRKRRFTVEQMIGVLKQAQAGVPVAEVIRKPTGIAGEIIGLESPNLPSEIALLESIIRDSLAPRLTGIVSRTVFCQERPVLILSIPRSWNAPHMVTFKVSVWSEPLL
jgi:hypothetical protein